MSTTEVEWTSELLHWYDLNKRDLPWRKTKDPYCIWVSEIMSQQTRIEAMRPYYENWMTQFPTKEALAAADEDTVVKAWQGLGYYSRARNLRLGVQEVMNKYGGEIPKTRKEVESLKGVGAYTAGAILSVAFNQREAAIDGNVLRVYARLYAVQEDIMRTAGKKAIAALVDETLPYDRPGDFNQALMDFGARVCIPKAPRCEGCPLRRWCKADALGIATELPVRIVKKAVPISSVITGLIQNEEGAYLLHRRPSKGLLHSMWEFPNVEVPRDALVQDKKELPLIGLDPLKAYWEEQGATIQWQDSCIATLRHVFSHRCWDMEAYVGRWQQEQRDTAVNFLFDDHAEWRWVAPEDFIDLPWAGPHGKLTVYCQTHEI
ncbi:A/G-specific adenine glycosylase [Veillonella intestinalis]|uniref:A/G-specific adenine glycosylase n=1 Tax=Veillonella intestinalis TaxID=2941341 RepID=UPI00203E6C2F|nr:A/G-specific adenine glycosylase [Veillonella intestinalis]